VAPDNVPICGMLTQPEVLEAKWPGTSPRLPWHCDISGYRGQISPDMLLGAFRLAWLWWADVLDITPEHVADASSALIRKHFAAIDGPSNVLAWSELADNTNRPKTQRYDSGDSWVIEESPASGIDLARVACHEIGHVLGLSHDTSNSGSLMAPSYSLRVRKPTDRDVQRALQLGYGRRASVPSPPPPGAPPRLLGRIEQDLDRRIIYVPAGWTVEVAR
jgi:hypothetical protein